MLHSCAPSETKNGENQSLILSIGGEEKTDYAKLIRIIKEGGYTGYVQVETLLVKGEPFDPFARVTGMLKELEAAIILVEYKTYMDP